MELGNIIIEGVVGSTCYGLDTETSDIDKMGIFVSPTRYFAGMDRFLPPQSYHRTKPDLTYHEVGKFVKLTCEKANPTLLELLFLDAYTVLTGAGRLLVDNRHLFLSNKIVHSYPGYAWNQAHKMLMRQGTYGSGMSKRYEKNTRHLLRIMKQGQELLSTGKLTLLVTPEVRQELFAAGKLPPNKVMDLFNMERKKFDNIKSVLPDEPDYDGVNKLLLKIRKGNW